MSKRVLVLAYYFPPLGGVGPQRAVKLIKHFPALGYDPIVVTGPEGDAVDFAPSDPVLAADVAVETRVERIRTLPPSAGIGQRRTRRLLGRWSALEAWWLREATAVARSLVGEFDLVHAVMTPFSSSVVAAEVAGEAGVPWVADLGDPWALDDWQIYPTALHRRLEQRRMRRALRSAAAIVMNTKEAAHALTDRFPELASTRIASITWGWDRDDFEGTPKPRLDKRFRIVYAGYSHVRRGLEHRQRRRIREVLGGAVRGLDILPRSHFFLAQAVGRLAQEDGRMARRLELHVAGPAPMDTRDGSDDLSIVHHGYLPHDQAVALVRSADLLFLAMHDLPSGLRTTTTPGKTFEYLASGRPILAALPDGDARDLLLALPNVWLCRPADVDCMAAALREAMAATPGSTDRLVDVLERFEWGNLARHLVALFDDAVSEVSEGG